MSRSLQAVKGRRGLDQGPAGGGSFMMKRAHRWKEFQSPFAWGPRSYDKKLESQERPDCAMGLDYKSDLHSVGTRQG